MSRRTLNLLALTLIAAWFAPGEAGAQAHGPPAQEIRIEVDHDDPVWRAAQVAEMDAWLRRLAGRYRDSKNTKTYEGERMDCTRIGEGAGVQCFSTLDSASLSAVRDSRGDSQQTEAKLLGMDPGALKVNYMQVNSRGLPEGGLGKVSGDTLTLRFECKIPQNAQNIISCEYRLRIFLPPDSDEVGVSTETTMRISSQRGTQEVISEQTAWLKRYEDGGSGIATVGAR